MNQNHHVTELIVALDFSRPDRALEYVDQLQGLPVLFQVGSELYLSGGPDLVREMVHRKHRVFLDLKFHDIPSVVARTARQAALLQVEMFSLHLAGGSAMVRAVAEELSDIPLLRPKILGISVLTSFDDVRWAEVTKALSGHASDTLDSALNLVEHAVPWGADGIICSAAELSEIRRLHPSLYTVVPGIRPEGWAAHDQARIATPGLARELGANAIVMGRPLLDGSHPRRMVESVLRELGPSAAIA